MTEIVSILCGSLSSTILMLLIYYTVKVSFHFSGKTPPEPILVEPIKTVEEKSDEPVAYPGATNFQFTDLEAEEAHTRYINSLQSEPESSDIDERLMAGKITTGGSVVADSKPWTVMTVELNSTGGVVHFHNRDVTELWKYPREMTMAAWESLKSYNLQQSRSSRNHSSGLDTVEVTDHDYMKTNADRLREMYEKGYIHPDDTITTISRNVSADSISNFHTRRIVDLHRFPDEVVVTKKDGILSSMPAGDLLKAYQSGYSPLLPVPKPAPKPAVKFPWRQS